MSADTKSINLARESVPFPQNWFSNLSSFLRLMALSVNIHETRQQSAENQGEGCCISVFIQGGAASKPV